MVGYIDNVIPPYFRRVRAEKGLPNTPPGLCIYDVFKGHKKDDVQTLMEENKVFTVFIPSNCTHLLLCRTICKSIGINLVCYFKNSVYFKF